MAEQKIEVHVTPKSSKNKIVKQPSLFPSEEPIWKAWVTAPPEDNKANEAVRRLVAETFDVSISHVSIVKGHTSRKKLVKIEVAN